MKNSEAYLRAAEKFANGTNECSGCCDVLSDILDNHDKAYALPELRLFLPPAGNGNYPWWWSRYDKEIRVLALCFMAAIAEDRERKL